MSQSNCNRKKCKENNYLSYLMVNKATPPIKSYFNSKTSQFVNDLMTHKMKSAHKLQIKCNFTFVSAHLAK